MNDEKIYRISRDKLLSLAQCMAQSQEQLIYEHKILRTVSKGFKDYTDEQKKLSQERIDSHLPWLAYELGGHIDMLLEDFPDLAEDEHIKHALNKRDHAIAFVEAENRRDGYKPRWKYTPDRK